MSLSAEAGRYREERYASAVPMEDRDEFDARVRALAKRCRAIAESCEGRGLALMEDALAKAEDRTYSCCSPCLVLGYYTRTPLTERLYRDAARKRLTRRLSPRIRRWHEYLLDGEGRLLGCVYHTDERGRPPFCPMFTAVLREGDAEYLPRYALEGGRAVLKELYAAEYRDGRIDSYHYYHVQLGTVGFLQLFRYDQDGVLESIRLFQAPMRMPGAEQTLRNLLNQPVTRQEIEVYTEAPYVYTDYDFREDGMDGAAR